MYYFDMTPLPIIILIVVILVILARCIHDKIRVLFIIRSPIIHQILQCLARLQYNTAFFQITKSPL